MEAYITISGGSLEIAPLAFWLTMNDAGAILPAAQFTRIHRSYIVANKKVTRMDKFNIRIGDICLPVGPGYTQELSKW